MKISVGSVDHALAGLYTNYSAASSFIKLVVSLLCINISVCSYKNASKNADSFFSGVIFYTVHTVY